MLGAVLPWTVVPQIFTFLALSASGLTFYSLARSSVRSSVAAAAACVYLANPYLLFVAYERTAYGELLGAITMPLVMLYALRRQPPVVRLALVVALLWFSNAPAAVMGCYLLGLCALSAALSGRSWRPAGRSLAALVLGAGLAGVYVLPAWYEQRWVEIARVVGPGMRVEDSFLFGHSGEPFHDQVLHTASWIALFVLGAGLLCVVVGWIARPAAPLVPPARERNDLCQPGSLLRPAALGRVLAAGLAAILLLQVPFSEPVWRLAPELRFLQFPWRWLLVGGLLATLAGAIAVEGVAGWPSRWRLFRNQRNRALQAGMALLLCGGALCAGHAAQHSFAQVCDDEDNVRAQEMLLAPSDNKGSPGGFEGTDEYTPAGADNGEIQKGLPPVRLLLAPSDDEGGDATTPNPEWQDAARAAGSARIEQWLAENKRVAITTPSTAYAVLRLMDYPAWQVLVNGHSIADRPHRDDGLLTIPVSPGTDSVEVSWQATRDEYAGRACSLAALGVLGVWAGWSSRRRAFPGSASAQAPAADQPTTSAPRRSGPEPVV